MSYTSSHSSHFIENSNSLKLNHQNHNFIDENHGGKFEKLLLALRVAHVFMAAFHQKALHVSLITSISRSP